MIDFDPQTLLAAIIDSSDDAIVSKTLEGVITSWNRAAEKMFGYTADEAIGQNIRMIIPLERHQEEEEVLLRIRRGEKVDHFETVRQAKDGRRLNISLTVSPIRNAEGRIIGASKVARDITELNRAEAARELLLRREQAARREAEKASRLKDEFLAVLSHELRSPLTAIVGWVTLLRKGGLNPSMTSRALDTIDRNVQIQSRLISDLLDMSKITSGKLQLKVETLDLPSVLAGAIEVTRPAAEAKGIRVQVLIDPAAGELIGDPDRLQQVFWNLLSNAVKFTPQGGRVEVSARSTNSHIEIVVTDTGIGMDPDTIPYIFDRFRQGDAGYAREHGGLGLGLSIVRSMVELHGGSVRAESRGRGKGSLFTVRLPGKPVFPFIPPKSDSRYSQKSLPGVRVLVVDDEDDAREVISAILTDASAETRSAANARDALDVLRHWRPHVLVADIGMPREDGYWLINQLRARPGSEGGLTPAIALTAYTRTEDRLRILSAGYQMHVSKPTQPAELVAVVASLAN